MKKERKNRPYFNILELTSYSLMETTGMDAMVFAATVQTATYTVEVQASMYEIMKYCKKAMKDEYRYFKSVRDRIPGPGEQQSLMMDILIEENYDFGSVMGNYILNKVNLDKVYAISQEQDEEEDEDEEDGMFDDGTYPEMDSDRMLVVEPVPGSLDPITGEGMKRFDSVEEFLEALNQRNRKQQELSEALVQCITDKVLEFYPDLAEADEELENFMHRTICKAADKVAERLAPPV
jgi:hypothetical protein